MASEAAINAIFFMLFSSSAEVLIYNAGGETFRGSAGTVTMRRDESRRYSRASSDFAESFGCSAATVTTGSTLMSRLPWLVWRITLDKPSRDHVRVAQISFGERDDD